MNILFFKKTFILLLLVFSFSNIKAQQSIVGKWRVIGYETNKERAVVEIYEDDGKFFGKVVKFAAGEQDNPVCSACTDDRKNQEIMGMHVIRNMEKVGKKYKNGKILDVENGEEYRCELWVEDGKLKVRGFLYFFYQTQEWLAYKEDSTHNSASSH